MLSRDRAILGLVQLGAIRKGRALTKRTFNNMVFVFSRDQSVPDTVRYDFLLENQHPFSFQLDRDIKRLTENGLLQTCGTADAIAIADDSHSQCREEYEQLPSAVREAVYEAAHTDDLSTSTALHGSDGSSRRLQEINKDLVSSGSKSTSHRLFTVGYEGETVDHFVTKLLRADIELVLDVRNRPISRKFGFSKNTLHSILTRVSIDYKHVPSLGIEASGRKDTASFDKRQALLDKYEQNIRTNTIGKCTDVLTLVSEHRTALLCMERDPVMCHRSRLSFVLSEFLGFTTEHL